MTGATGEPNTPQPRRLGLPQVSRALGVSYWRIWSRVNSGEIVADPGANGRCTIAETDLPRIAEKLGLRVETSPTSAA